MRSASKKTRFEGVKMISKLPVDPTVDDAGRDI